MRRATGKILVSITLRFDFYPRSPCGERRASQSYSLAIMRFLSTLSLRRATMLSAIRTNCIMYFYPRSPCGERRYWPCVHVVGRSISIHALLAESDTDEVLTNDEQTISIHALLAESDNADTKTPHFTNYFYPRSPCGERRFASDIFWYPPGFLSTLSLRRATNWAAYI